MNPLRINIVLPFPSTKPGGGMKVMYEYANRLQAKGHQVTILHSILRPYKKTKSPLWWKKLVYGLRGASRPRWFSLDKNVKSVIVPEITDEFVPDGDIVLSTWWEMAFMISRLHRSKGIPFNLIQGYEVWKGNHELVHQSYKLDIHHLVIAKYLQNLVEEHSGKKPLHLPIAIDTEVFYQEINPSERNPLSILMLYSDESVKGSQFGMRALTELKKLEPQLQATFFSVDKKPMLPHWIAFHQRPSNLRKLYNEHAIFLSPSILEGWALPPAEAMACGCAVVCTNIGGHQDYAVDGQTALLAEPENIPDMVAKLQQLIADPRRRIELARKGKDFITENFSWHTSANKLEDIFMRYRTATPGDIN